MAELRVVLALLSGLQESPVPETAEARALGSYKEYFPEPDVPDDLTDWTSVKRTWGELVKLPHSERGLAIRESANYLDPPLCDWLVLRAKKVSLINPNSAVSIAEVALEIARQREARFGDSRRLMLALGALAWCLVAVREFSLARPVLEELGNLCDAVGTGTEEKAGYLATKGVYHSQIGQFREGKACLAQALELRRKSGSRKDVVCQIVNLAGAELSAGESQHALELCREAVGLLKAEQDPPRLQFALYCNLALALCETGQSVEARRVLATVRKLAGTVGGWYSKAYAIWLDGTLSRAEGQYLKAEEIFEGVRAEFLARGHLVWHVEASLDLARIYLLQGRLGDLGALVNGLLARAGDLGVDERVRFAVARLAQAVEQRSLSGKMLNSIVIALRSVRVGQRF